MHVLLPLPLVLLLFLSPPIHSASLNLPVHMFLTGENCTSDDECASGRSCLFSSGNKFDSCSDDEHCFCFPNTPQICTQVTQCPEGEVCAETPIDNDPVCVAMSLVNSNPSQYRPIPQSNSTSDSPTSTVCIDARLLSHLPAHHLVFPSHNPAVVLCDPSGSCATPGHMVVWRAHSMMMRTYCNQLPHPCRQAVMPVNSPRWHPRRRVNTYTDGLQFTAFAARYHTRWEEAVLRHLVHAGL